MSEKELKELVDQVTKPLATAMKDLLIMTVSALCSLGVICLCGAIEEATAAEEFTQPPVEEDLLCYDYAMGVVYSCFVREDGDIQLRINPEGNRVIARTIETAEYKMIVEEQQK